MGGCNEAEEELGSVGAWASVGHGKDSATGMLVDEVLILKLATVDGSSASAVVRGEIATLGHEVVNDSVERAALVVESGKSGGPFLLASAKSTKVFGGLRGVREKLDSDATCGYSTDGNIEEDFGVLSCGWVCLNLL